VLRLKKNIKYGLLLILLGIGALYFLDHYLGLIRYPIGWTNTMVAIEAEPTYIPIDYQKSYATIRTCGKRCEIVKFIYKGSNEKLVVIATDYVSWSDDPKWDKSKKIPGTNYYYENENGKQQLNWRDEKEELELRLEYTGEPALRKEEMVKIANSIDVEGQKLN
jgi:hypothetical protein